LKLFEGVRLVGFTKEGLTKLLLTLVLIAIVIVLRRSLNAATRSTWKQLKQSGGRFWVRQAIMLASTAVLIGGGLSIWFDQPARLATFLGLVSAGIAFALQSVITAIAGYFVIISGSVYRIGDRIVLGSVRGDVIAVSLLHTTIMEMGQPPPVQDAEPAVWISSRQYTGRIAIVSNAQVFSNPVFNYSRDFAYIWDQLTIAVQFGSDYQQAEAIILDTARRHTEQISNAGRAQFRELQDKYDIDHGTLQPTTYYHITPDWLKITVRFLVEPHGAAQIKDAMARDIMAAFTEQKIGLGDSPTEQQIVSMPPIQVADDGVAAGDGAGLPPM
jgi:small-conductance mechanosensitive channel